MDKIINHLQTPVGIIDLCLSLVLISSIIFFSYKFKFSKIATASLVLSLLTVVIVSFFDFTFLRNIVLLIATAIVFLICLSHVGAIRAAVAKIGKRNATNKKVGFGKLVNRDALYNEVYEAVAACSRQKIGALITFEKHDDLTNLTKNGTVINAPVTNELLLTIFYPGTRLHDGAVIIRDNMIYAASVYYTPTTKALTGKYGSRHRAAIGISEICDAVTVVVSEETGRISFAQGGELEPVTLDDFVAALTERINQGE